MKAIILAAGFGTRLKPWTDFHPKALAEIDGVPVLELTIRNLEKQGFDEICVNIHHFGDQITDFIAQKRFNSRILISDERDGILDTGGGILKAYELFETDEPVLIHNVDILSNADLNALMKVHNENNNDSTLLVSKRDSTRKFLFDKEMNLRGWHNLKDNIFKLTPELPVVWVMELAFSGIHVAGPRMIEEMRSLFQTPKFPVNDYFLNTARKSRIKGHLQEDLKLLDIGKPASLTQAVNILREINA